MVDPRPRRLVTRTGRKLTFAAAWLQGGSSPRHLVVQEAAIRCCRRSRADRPTLYDADGHVDGVPITDSELRELLGW